MSNAVIAAWITVSILSLTLAIMATSNIQKERHVQYPGLLTMFMTLHLILIMSGSAFVFWTFGITRFYCIPLLILVLIALHWPLFRNECILSMVEKMSIDPSYVMGSEYPETFSRFHPYGQTIISLLFVIGVGATAYTFFRRGDINRFATYMSMFAVGVTYVIIYKHS